MKLTIIYAIFAAIATIANICAQDLVTRGYVGTFSVPVSVACGTVAGLLVKYVLDKRYIFGFRAQNATHDGRIFVLYAAMGLATTVIFWAFEFGFNHLFETKEMRYVGGIMGLAVGYVAKYHLDKRFVFHAQRNQ